MVHDLALAHAGSAMIQVAISSHPNKYEVAIASRTLHVWWEQVKQHVTFRHSVHLFATSFSRHAGQHFPQEKPA